MGIREIFKKLRMGSLKTDLTDVNIGIRAKKMYLAAATNANDGQHPTGEYLAKERALLYADKFKIIKKLCKVKGINLSYQTI